MIKTIYISVLCTCISFVVTLEYSRIADGYALGYTYGCPSNFKQAAIRPENLDQLFISVMGENTRTVSTFDYYHIGDLAQHPDVDFSKRTVMFVAGHHEFSFLPTAKTIGTLYKELGYNVLILNTMAFTTGPYVKAATYVRSIGKYTAYMLANLTAHGLDPKKLDLLGPDLGAHSMGFIGRNYRRLTGRNVSSITAIDPAGPCFRTLGPEARLDPADADFVLNMVVNMDGLGMATPLGHVTFYVNGGEYQPADVWYMPCGMECSHVKGYLFWASAVINPRLFVGIQCDSIQQARDSECYDRKPLVWNTMGLFTDRAKPGVYFLPTHHIYPYGLGMAGIKKKNEMVINHVKSLNADDVKKVK